MKYIITIKENRIGKIEVLAESRKDAESKALKIAIRDPERLKWDESKYHIADVQSKMMLCVSCNAEISSDSEFCNKCGNKVNPENEIDLGKVYSAMLDASCQTKTLLKKFHGDAFGERCDTLLLHTRHSIMTEKDKYYPSFYIREKPLNCTTETICTGFTITDIKTMFSPGRETRIVDEDFYIEMLEKLEGRTRFQRRKWHLYIEKMISHAFYKGKFDSNGDVFFEKAVSFTAQKSNPNESGRMSTYYIVGMNLKVMER